MTHNVLSSDDRQLSVLYNYLYKTILFLQSEREETIDTVGYIVMVGGTLYNV